MGKCAGGSALFDHRTHRTTAAASVGKQAELPAQRALFKEVSHDLGLDVRMSEETVNEASLQRLVPFRFNRRGPAWR